MQNKKYKLAVVIGRFQPLHNGHVSLIDQAISYADKVIVIVGSINQPRTPKNPFTFEEREKMIRFQFKDKVWVAGVEDTLYSNQQWVGEVQFVIQELTSGMSVEDKDIVLLGHHRDDSSFYLDMFPQWKYVELPVYEGNLNGTAIRNLWYESLDFYDSVPNSTEQIMNDADSGVYNNLVKEYDYLEQYKEMWENAPYPVNFVTTDAVVVQSGHVLMIKRGGFPGKGLWALPGGFLNTRERVIDGIIRELREETKLKVPEKVLRGFIKEIEVFDEPSRSERGRTITHTALIELEQGHTLPKVKGSDDASEARWIPVSRLRRMRNEIYEDHYDIIFKLISNL